MIVKACLETEKKDDPCGPAEYRHLQELEIIASAIRKISHEFSQSLTVIQGYLELLELGKLRSSENNLKMVMDNISGQIAQLLSTQDRLKEVVHPERIGFADYAAGRRHGEK